MSDSVSSCCNLYCSQVLCNAFQAWKGLQFCRFDPLRGFLRTLDTYIIGSLYDEGHIKIILFNWFLCGVTALIQRGGGGQVRTPAHSLCLAACLICINFSLPELRSVHLASAQCTWLVSLFHEVLLW